MRDIDAFWEVPGFWFMVLVILLFAAAATFVICKGPGEAPYDSGEHPFISTVDADTKHAWDLSLPEWDALGPESRAWYRENITKGPRFHELLR